MKKGTQCPTRKSGPTSSRTRKLSNSSLNVGSPSTATRCASQRVIHPWVGSQRNLNEPVTPGKSSMKSGTRAHVPRSRGDNVVLVHKTHEDGVSFLRQKLTSQKQSVPSIRRQTDKSYVRPNNHAKSPVASGGSPMEIEMLRPFDAEQIIEATSKFSERVEKLASPSTVPHRYMLNSGGGGSESVAAKVYTTNIGRYPCRSQQNSFDVAMSPPTVQRVDQSALGPRWPAARSEMRSPVVKRLNYCTITTPIVPEATGIIGTKAREMEESKASDAVSQQDSASILSAPTTVTKLRDVKDERPAAAAGDKDSTISLRCKCKRDAELPCCVKAAAWLRSMYRNQFDLAKYKKLYEVIELVVML